MDLATIAVEAGPIGGVVLLALDNRRRLEQLRRCLKDESHAVPAEPEG